MRWAPARRPAAQPAAQPRSQQTPLARPSTWAFFCTPSRAVARLDLSNLPAVLLKRVVGRSLSPSVVRACAWSAASAAVWAGSRRRSVGRFLQAALGGRRRLRGARRAGLGTPAGIAAPTRAWAVGARPPPRCPPCRPTSLAADTAGAARNLGVFYDAVACRRAPRSIEPASGAAEAGVGPPQVRCPYRTGRDRVPIDRPLGSQRGKTVVPGRCRWVMETSLICLGILRKEYGPDKKYQHERKRSNEHCSYCSLPSSHRICWSC